MLMRKVEQLRKKEEQLRKEKEQLRDKELLLLKMKLTPQQPTGMGLCRIS